MLAPQAWFFGPFDELAVDEDRVGADEGDQVGCVDHAPPALRGLDELERHGQRGVQRLGQHPPRALADDLIDQRRRAATRAPVVRAAASHWEAIEARHGALRLQASVQLLELRKRSKYTHKRRVRIKAVLISGPAAFAAAKSGSGKGWSLNFMPGLMARKGLMLPKHLPFEKWLRIGSHLSNAPFAVDVTPLAQVALIPFGTDQTVMLIVAHHSDRRWLVAQRRAAREVTAQYIGRSDNDAVRDVLRATTTASMGTGS